MSEDKPATFGQVVMVLREWAQAIRGDWSDIDGRSCKTELNKIADTLIAAQHHSGSQVTVRELRSAVGVCPDGAAHWDGYCDEDRDCVGEAANRFADRSAS